MERGHEPATNELLDAITHPRQRVRQRDRRQIVFAECVGKREMKVGSRVDQGAVEVEGQQLNAGPDLGGIDPRLAAGGVERQD